MPLRSCDVQLLIPRPNPHDRPNPHEGRLIVSYRLSAYGLPPSQRKTITSVGVHTSPAGPRWKEDDSTQYMRAYSLQTRSPHSSRQPNQKTIPTRPCLHRVISYENWLRAVDLLGMVTCLHLRTHHLWRTIQEVGLPT